MNLHKLSHRFSSSDDITRRADELGFVSLLPVPEALLLKSKTTGEIYWLEVGAESIGRLSCSGLDCVAEMDVSGDFELIRGDAAVLALAKRPNLPNFNIA